MEHLNTLDAGFLEAEDSDRHISLAVGGLSIIEGPMPDFAALLAGIAERIEKLPRSKQVLRTHALDLNPPEWVDDDAFDHRTSHPPSRTAATRRRQDVVPFHR